MILRNTFLMLLVLAVAGAVIFCVYTGIIAMKHMTHNMPLAHAIHAAKMVLAPVNVISTVSAITFFLAALTLFGIFHASRLFLWFELVLRSWRRVAEIPYTTQQQAGDWLTLFERSPECIGPA